MTTGQIPAPPCDVRVPPLPSLPAELGSGNGSWQESLKKVVSAIVVIRVSAVSAFDGESPGYSYATGFVVDKARGIILTNRHVVTAGPAVADAVFMNKEEVDLKTIYYDPVHDFGFFRFDPKAVKFLEVAEIALNPEGAKVGVEIRVVGNDSGEKLSILPGILARLDRAAPDYGSGGYRDFNTFYLAAASSTSGGSSGSPVLTVDGKAVALNCGATAETAAAFYLPLPKIARALAIIQRGDKVSRGTIQTVLKHTAFDEARRLGLTTDAEAAIRKEFPEETGVLVVSQVVPKGPADEIIEPGDVIMSMNGEMITTFLPWEGYLDGAVGGEVEVEVQRGGKTVKASLTVGDLHAITPSEYLDVSSGVLHPLSYQQARNYNLPVEGVYLAQAGYMMERAWVVSQCLITSIGSDPTPNLDACEAALSKHPDGARVSMRYKALTDRHRTKTAVITMDRKWFPMQRVRRNDDDGLWHSTPSPLPPQTPSPAIRKPTAVADCAANGASNGETARGAIVDGSAGAAAGPPASISSSLVMVSFDIPHLVDGVSGSYCIGVGVVVDKELGLVVVDRTTVQVALGDVMLTFNGSEEVAARPIFVHPVQNFSVVQFDPSVVKGSFSAAALSSRETEDHDNVSDSGNGIGNGIENGIGIRSCDDGEGVGVATAGDESDGSPPPLRPGDTAEFHGLTSAYAPVRQRTVVVKLERLSLASSVHPQFTAHSVEVLQFDQIASCLGGVFVAAPRDAAGSSSSLSSPSSSSSSSSLTTSPPSSSQISTTASVNGGVNGGDGRGEGGATKGASARPAHAPVISAFWHSFSFSGADGRKHTMRGLPAPVVRRALERIRRDFRKRELAQLAAPVADSAPVALPMTASGSGEVEEEEVVVERRGETSQGVEAAAAEEEPGKVCDSCGSDDEGGGGSVENGVGVTSVRGRQEAAPGVETDGVEACNGAPTPNARADDGIVRADSVATDAVPRYDGKVNGTAAPAAAGAVATAGDGVGTECGGGEGGGGGNAEDAEGVRESNGPINNNHSNGGDEASVSVVGGEGGPGDGEGAAADVAAEAPGATKAGDGGGGGGIQKLGIVPAASSSGSENDGVDGEGRMEDAAEQGAGGCDGKATVGAANSVVAAGTRGGIGLDGAEESLGAAPCLPLQLVTVELSKARAGLGLSEAWSRRVEAKCGERQKQVLEVRRCMAGTPAFSVIETGDIILAVEGKLVTRFREVEVAVEEMEGKPVRLRILRELEEREVTVVPSYLPTRETDRLFMWAGLMVQTPHLAVLQLGFLPKQGGGVYSSRWCYGSPAHKYSLGCTTWIVEVNGMPTPTLDAFLEAVKDIGDTCPARVKTVGLDSKVEVTTFRTDHHYWPTLELRRSEEGWTRTLHTGPKALSGPPAGGGSSGVQTASPAPHDGEGCGSGGSGSGLENASEGGGAAVTVNGGKEEGGGGGEGGGRS